MSIVALKRKTDAKYKNVSANEINGFSLNGTKRLQGYIGQTSLSRHTSFTPMKGTVAKGHGGCCGKYDYGRTVKSATMINVEDNKIVKGSVLNTSGMLAERENKVDLIAGIDKEVDNEVFSILLDLQRRDTKNASASFAEIYVSKIRDNGYRALKRPHRQAGFAVLKSSDIPSVLVELGFLSNPKDAKYLSNKNSRARVLKALSEAIIDYVKIRSRI